jgi:hypothetical protein
MPYKIKNNEQGVIERYNLTLNVDNYTTNGIVLTDSRGASVIVVGIGDESPPPADVYVVTQEGMMIGWCDQPNHISDVKLLHKMPKEFTFTYDCPHLSVYGGYAIGNDYMTCFGCGAQIA